MKVSLYMIEDNLKHDIPKLYFQESKGYLDVSDVFVCTFSAMIYLDEDEVGKEQKNNNKKSYFLAFSNMIKNKDINIDVQKFRLFTKDELHEVFKEEILPNYDLTYQIYAVQDLEVIKDISNDGKVFLKEKKCEVYAKGKSPNPIEYGAKRYVNIKKEIWSYGELGEVLTPFVAQYCQNFEEHIAKGKTKDNEDFKWEATTMFSEKFDIESNDLAKNISYSLERADILFNGYEQYVKDRPDKILEQLIRLKPTFVKDSFKRFQNKKDLTLNIEHFKTIAQWIFKIAIAKGVYQSNYRYMQDNHAISVYISLMYPKKYYIYKSELLDNFIEYTKLDITRVKHGAILEEYFKLCDKIKEVLESNEELIKKHDAMFPDDLSDHHLLVYDFIHFCSQRYTNN